MFSINGELNALTASILFRRQTEDLLDDKSFLCISESSKFVRS